MTVAAIDLSLTATGFCRLVNGGVPELTSIKSQSQTKPTYVDRSWRIQVLRDLILAAATGLHGPPELVVIEGPSVMSKGGSNWDRAGLWWQIVQHLIESKQQVAVVPPTTLKKWATGKGTADKVAVAVHMSRLWPETDAASDNEWDATALATMGAQWLGYDVPRRAHHETALSGAEWPPIMPLAS